MQARSAHIECLTNQILMSGDHAIVVGLVEGAPIRTGEPLLYFDGQYRTFAELPTAEPVSSPASP